MVETKKQNIIYKKRKYAFQFPDNVSTDAQKKYIEEVEKNFEEHDIVTIDSKIKVYPRDDVYNTDGEDNSNTDTKKTEGNDKNEYNESKTTDRESDTKTEDKGEREQSENTGESTDGDKGNSNSANSTESDVGNTSGESEDGENTERSDAKTVKEEISNGRPVTVTRVDATPKSSDDENVGGFF